MSNEERPGLSTRFRSLAIWALVVVVALVAGFGMGYFFQYKQAQELRQVFADQKAELTAQITSLEKEVLEAQKSQLERALAVAKLKVGLEEVLSSLIAASVEVEQKNFGRALQKVEAAKGSLTGAGGPTASVREAVGAKLDEIRGGLEQLDMKVLERITTLVRDLEKGAVPGQTSE